jgi:DNA-binding NtrC family response regulator
MEEMRLKILILDDDPVYRRLSLSILKERYHVFVAAKPSEAFSIIASENIDFIISDYRLPEMDGLEVLDRVKRDYPKTEVIMISDSGNIDTVIHALRKGAIDYFKKPFTAADIWMAIEKSRKYVALKNDYESEKRKSDNLQQYVNKEFAPDMIGNSTQMSEIRNQIAMLAQTPDTSVLILGESGTGKELVARAIHNMSDRKQEFFGAVNMSAIPEQLFESEFFGHKKGSFTGAISDKTGWFESANKGTLFLDEIGDMPLNLQVKLLRVLEDRTYTKVGTQKSNPFDIRVIAATNKPIKEITGNKNFRADLFHRLGTFIIHMPPLRDRNDDIQALVKYFVQQFASKMNKTIHEIKPGVFRLLQNYSFPGNIRELRNIIERAVILSVNGVINENSVMLIDNFTENEEEDCGSNTFNLAEIEKLTIMRALNHTNNNIAEAARLLNIEWNALYRRLGKYNINLQR